METSRKQQKVEYPKLKLKEHSESDMRDFVASDDVIILEQRENKSLYLFWEIKNFTLEG